MRLRAHFDIARAGLDSAMPIAARSLPTRGEADVWVFDLIGHPRQNFEALAYLDAIERERMMRFVRDEDRRRFAFGRATVRRILSAYDGRTPEELPLSAGANGKPFLRDSANLAFNLSHSHDVGLLAVAAGSLIGADVERVVPIAEDVAGAYFSESEQAAYRALAAHDRLEGFYRFWTLKEAMVKAVGDGLFMSLADFDVELGPPPRLARLAAEPDAPRRWSLATFVPRVGWIAALALRPHDDAPALAKRAPSGGDDEAGA